MAFIEADYRDMLRQAGRLDDLARKLRTTASRDLQELQAGVGRQWRGSAAVLYKKRTTTLIRQAEQQARDLQKMASSLRTAAERYQRIEQAAKILFGV